MGTAYEGADVLGFLVGSVYRDPDEISIDTFKELLRYVPVFVTPVVITYFSSPEAILSLTDRVNLNTIQVNSNISIEDIKKIKQKNPNLKILKEIHFGQGKKIDLKELNSVNKYIDTLILNFKGTKNVSASEIKEFIQYLDIPVMLSNVPIDITKKVLPYGVVLKDEIKGHDGFKNFDKLRRYVGELKSISNRTYYTSI